MPRIAPPPLGRKIEGAEMANGGEAEEAAVSAPPLLLGRPGRSAIGALSFFPLHLADFPDGEAAAQRQSVAGAVEVTLGIEDSAGASGESPEAAELEVALNDDAVGGVP